MKNFKKLLAIIAVVGVLGASGVVYAADIKSPADIVSGLTGKTAQDVTTERAEGKTYGTIANESGKLDEFKSQMLEQKKVILDQRVKDGRLTQEQADEIYNAIKDNQANCIGNGSAGIGRNGGAGFGQGNGAGRGQGACGGLGMGAGRGLYK